MKNVLLVSPYFLPSNLAGVHRVRLMSGRLAAYGWNPTILTVDAKFYEERCDPALLHLIPEGVRVDRVPAWPAKLCRPLGIGDVSLRGQSALRRRLGELVQRRRPEVVFATVLPGYTALVGSWARRHFNIPFVLDYQDPWVPPSTQKIGWNKAGISNRIARLLEPGVLRQVDALTAVSDGTLDSLRSRNLLPADVPIEVIPIGADRRDHLIAAEYGRSHIAREDGVFHVAYLGTLTTRMLPALDAVFDAVGKARGRSVRNFRLHLIGTSAEADGDDQHDLLARAARFHIADIVRLHAARVSYLDALRTMKDADLLLLVGSTDSHYTASKLFPSWLSGKPLLGVFHRGSTIVKLADELGGVRVVRYDEERGPEMTAGETAELLTRAAAGSRIATERNEHAFEAFSADGVASRFARLFDRVAAKCA